MRFSIFFAPRLAVAVGSNPGHVFFKDFDLDGRQAVAIRFQPTSSLSAHDFRPVLRCDGVEQPKPLMKLCVHERVVVDHFLDWVGWNPRATLLAPLLEESLRAIPAARIAAIMMKAAVSRGVEIWGQCPAPTPMS